MSLPQIPVASHWLNRFLGSVPAKSSLGDGVGAGGGFTLLSTVPLHLLRRRIH